MRMLRVAVIAAAVLVAVTACSPPVPAPTPHYTVAPLVLPGNLRIDGSGASVCSTDKSERDVVFGFGIVNKDTVPLALTGVSFKTVTGGHLAGAWTVNPTAPVTSSAGLVTSEFSYPPDLDSWASRALLTGTTLAPGASTYVLLHLVSDGAGTNTLFLDPGIRYLKSGTTFTAETTSSGYQHVASGRCVFTDD